MNHPAVPPSTPRRPPSTAAGQNARPLSAGAEPPTCDAAPHAALEVTSDAAAGTVPDATPAGSGPARPAWTRLAVLVVLVAALASWVALGGGAGLLHEVRQWVDSLGLWGPVVFALCYAVAVTVLLPGSVLTASAGALFGLALGTAAVLAGATAGAALSFGLARWLGRPAVARYAGSGRLARLDSYLTRRGFAAVLLVRLVPLFPFSVINYGAGVAGVRFSSYLAATALGIIPGTVVYTGLGGSLGDPASPALWIALGGLLVLSAGGWWAARLVRSRGGEFTGAAGSR
ncbi:TVP38/TMEM64 family protein [Streptomyces pacificus]|uniref:TVP38/TMEM64 family membrane protein n=1 Tax=Streptomyces pacificus TaxID=2705029 RepID=A0A6A0B0L3_9ACTN|nr:TVP38/TMEM64 family protein [Streptomyces pacificus]GFH37784.1 TVP38/TMEM64 family protein [Streptomyces pacificus]